MNGYTTCTRTRTPISGYLKVSTLIFLSYLLVIPVKSHITASVYNSFFTQNKLPKIRVMVEKSLKNCLDPDTLALHHQLPLHFSIQLNFVASSLIIKIKIQLSTIDTARYPHKLRSLTYWSFNMCCLYVK